MISFQPELSVSLSAVGTPGALPPTGTGDTGGRDFAGLLDAALPSGRATALTTGGSQIAEFASPSLAEARLTATSALPLAERLTPADMRLSTGRNLPLPGAALPPTAQMQPATLEPATAAPTSTAASLAPELQNDATTAMSLIASSQGGMIVPGLPVAKDAAPPVPASGHLATAAEGQAGNGTMAEGSPEVRPTHPLAHALPAVQPVAFSGIAELSELLPEAEPDLAPQSDALPSDTDTPDAGADSASVAGLALAITVPAAAPPALPSGAASNAVPPETSARPADADTALAAYAGRVAIGRASPLIASTSLPASDATGAAAAPADPTESAPVPVAARAVAVAAAAAAALRPAHADQAAAPTAADSTLPAALAAAVPEVEPAEGTSTSAPSLPASNSPPALAAAAPTTSSYPAPSLPRPEPRDPAPAPHQQSAIAQVGDLREALRSAQPAMVLNHADFGAVSVRLEAAGTEGWRAVIASRDPGFVPAVQQALADRAVAAAAATSGDSGAFSGHSGAFQNGAGEHRSGSSLSGGQGGSQPYLGQSASRDGEAAPDHRRHSTAAAIAARAEVEEGGSAAGQIPQSGGLFA